MKINTLLFIGLFSIGVMQHNVTAGIFSSEKAVIVQISVKQYADDISKYISANFPFSNNDNNLEDIGQMVKVLNFTQQMLNNFNHNLQNTLKTSKLDDASRAAITTMINLLNRECNTAHARQANSSAVNSIFQSIGEIYYVLQNK